MVVIRRFKNHLLSSKHLLQLLCPKSRFAPFIRIYFQLEVPLIPWNDTAIGVICHLISIKCNYSFCPVLVELNWKILLPGHFQAEPESSEGNQLWICPACGRPDDGSPMIACDACDMWYHYTCVGILDTPEGDWFCMGCINRRPDLVDKKKKHKKKKWTSWTWVVWAVRRPSILL